MILKIYDRSRNGNNLTMGPCLSISKKLFDVFFLSSERKEIKAKFVLLKEHLEQNFRRKTIEAKAAKTIHGIHFWSAARVGGEAARHKKGKGDKKKCCFIDSCKMRRREDEEWNGIMFIVSPAHPELEKRVSRRSFHFVLPLARLFFCIVH